MHLQLFISTLKSKLEEHEKTFVETLVSIVPQGLDGTVRLVNDQGYCRGFTAAKNILQELLDEHNKRGDEDAD